jgi:molecular chaperone GrpE
VKKLRESAQKDALRKVAGKILPLADSLARARNVAEETAGAEQITEGLRMTEEEFYAILQQLDIEPIESLGQRFDPTYHEAVFQIPAPDAEPNTVIEEIKKGFLFKGELLRAAQVVVAQPSGG